MHPLLRAVAERQYGVFTAADARRAGYQHAEIRHLCCSGTWVRLRRGVYATAADLTAADARHGRHRVECLAVLRALRRPSSAVSHTSAARLWGLPVSRGTDSTVRLTDPEHYRRGEGFRMARAPLPAGDVVTAGPLRFTSIGRTLVDYAREVMLDDAVVAMDAALLTGRTSPEELDRRAAAVRHWPGASRARRAVSLADGRAESPLETQGRLRIIGSGFPGPELQVEIHANERLLAVVDGWYDEAAVAVEFDGRIKYTQPWRERSPGEVLWAEKRREDALRALDIRLLRIADADLGGRWQETERRLASLLSRPGPSHRDFTAVPRARGLRRTG